MKAIELKDLTDNQFLLYMNLIIRVRNKYKEKEYVLDYDWNEYRDYYFSDYTDFQKFKENRLKVLNEGIKNSLKEYVIFDNENPVAFIACKKLSGDRNEFIYDSAYSESTEEVLKTIYKILFQYTGENDIKFISYLANRKRDIDSFKTAGIEITQNVFTSKLLREEISFEKLTDIIAGNKHVKDYDLVLYREVPEEIYDRYVDFMNDALPAKDFYNPVKEEFVKYRLEDLLGRIKNDKEDGDPMYMYMLFDKEIIAAYCKVYIEKEDDNVFIQHCGGLTGVSVKYRGKGFAKYLKASMYLKILEDYPEFKHAITDTYPWNKYMYKINEELGFKVYNEGCIFNFTKETLENLIK